MNCNKFIFTLLALSMSLSFCVTVDNSTDKTMTEGAKGRDVVEAVINKIKSSGIFTDDHGYLLRAAFVTAKFGEEGSRNLIWFFENALISNKFDSYYPKIQQHLGIDWTKIIFSDYSKPLICGLAEYLYFVSRQLTIPVT